MRTDLQKSVSTLFWLYLMLCATRLYAERHEAPPLQQRTVPSRPAPQPAPRARVSAPTPQVIQPRPQVVQSRTQVIQPRPQPYPTRTQTFAARQPTASPRNPFAQPLDAAAKPSSRFAGSTPELTHLPSASPAARSTLSPDRHGAFGDPARLPSVSNVAARPAPSNVLHPIPAHLLAGRQTWQTAVTAEKNAQLSTNPAEGLIYRQQALAQYRVTLDNLGQNSQGTRPDPETRLSLAKTHLDAARVLYSLNQPGQAAAEVHSAELLLRDLIHPGQDSALSDGALWRSYYLLGDVNLYQNNPAIALHYYQQAQALCPDFVPATAMIEYLGGSVTASPTACVNTAPPTDVQSTPQKPSQNLATSTSQSTPASSPGTASSQPTLIATASPPPPVAPSPSPTVAAASTPPNATPRAAATAPAQPSRAAAPPTPTVVTPRPRRPVTVQPQDIAGKLVVEMRQLSANQTLKTVATGVELFGKLLGITELGPLAAGISIAAIIVDVAVKP